MESPTTIILTVPALGLVYACAMDKNEIKIIPIRRKTANTLFIFISILGGIKIYILPRRAKTCYLLLLYRYIYIVDNAWYNMEIKGEAYAFFDCNATKAQIEAELPGIRKAVKTPSGLEISLTDMNEFLGTQLDEDLRRFVDTKDVFPTYPSSCPKISRDIRPRKLRDLKYAIKVKYSEVIPQDHVTQSAVNEYVASELKPICSGINSVFGHKRSPYTSEVVVNTCGEYLFME